MGTATAAIRHNESVLFISPETILAPRHGCYLERIAGGERTGQTIETYPLPRLLKVYAIYVHT